MTDFQEDIKHNFEKLQVWFDTQKSYQCHSWVVSKKDRRFYGFGERAFLDGETLKRLDLTSVNLERASLRGIDLSNAVLQNASLSYVIFTGAVLQDAYLMVQT